MIQLKLRPPLFILLFLTAISLGLTACSGDDFAGNNGDDGDGQRFSVSVTDGGYSSADGDKKTRAAEDGYITEFTAGDRIGVFAVKNGSIRPEVNNLCLTASIEGSKLVWKDAGGNAPMKFDGATYYAYYPYQGTLTGTLDASATDGATFFADIISNWAPNTDQGTYAKYTAQDLMIAKGSIGSSGLSFGMEHKMALVVIELPGKKYEFSNTNSSVSDYITDPLDTRFDNYKPLRINGRYRYLVNTGSSTQLSGGYTDVTGVAKGWGVNASSISRGSFKHYYVDGGWTTISGYNLQVGDYMMKDGTLVGKDEILTSAQKAKCIGVVYWIDPDGINHGKIVSLDQQTLLRWGDNNIDEQAAGVEGIRDSSDGYQGTFNLINKRKDQSDFSTTYSAFYWIYQKNNNDVNGFWYMPAIDELKTLYNVRGTINPKIISAGGAAVSFWNYYSSTEISLQRAAIIDMDNGSTTNYLVNKNNVDNSTYIRAIARF